MCGSVALDTALGIVFVYVLLFLLCSGINELLARGLPQCSKRNLIFCLVLSLATLSVCASALAVAKVSPAEIETRVESLLSNMTMGEKIGQMTQYAELSDHNKDLIRQGKVGSFLSVSGAKETREASAASL